MDDNLVVFAFVTSLIFVASNSTIPVSIPTDQIRFSYLQFGIVNSADFF